MRPYYRDKNVTLYHGDAREVVSSLPAVDVVVTSPPYSDLRTYGAAGAFDWDGTVPPVLSRVLLQPEGQVLVNLGLKHDAGEVVCYWQPLIGAMRSAGYRLFGWYVWDQGSGIPGEPQGRFASSHEWLFHFNRKARGPEKFVPCMHAGRGGISTHRERDGSLRESTSVRRDGKPAVIQSHKIPDSVVRINRVCHSKEDYGDHPAPYPLELASYLIQSFPGTVLDPFAGSGTTLRAAKNLGLKAIGIEIEEKYCEIIVRRMAQETLF